MPGSISWKRQGRSRDPRPPNQREAAFLRSTRKRMVPELAVHQRGLVDRKILFADSEVEARYILPFVDRRWKIPFAVLDLREGRPLVFDGPFRLDRFRFRTVSRTGELRPIESVSLDDLRELAHFDPWWVFRRSTGVQRPWVEAVFATNRSEERRVGKECRSRWGVDDWKKKG